MLEAQLFAAFGTKQGHWRRAESDSAAIHRELKHKHVTLQILWDEYIEQRAEPRRVSLLAVLRPVPRLGIAGLGDDAADPCRR